MKNLIGKKLLALIVGVPLASCQCTDPMPTPWGPDMSAMVERASTRLLERERAARGDAAPLYEVRVAILPVTYSGTIEGGGNATAVHASVARALANSGMFSPISRHLVENAVNASGISDARALMGLAAAQKRFMTVLTNAGQIPEYLVYPELTTEEQTEKGIVVWRKTVLNLQLARADDGVVAHEEFGELVQGRCGRESQ